MNLQRGINKPLLTIFRKSPLFQLLKDDELNKESSFFLGIRHNSLNIYYKGASLAKVALKKNELSINVAKKYVDHTTGNGQVHLELTNFLSKIDVIKKNIDSIQKSKEKIAQQLLVNNNNKNAASNWFCVDIEYVMKRDISDNPSYGRFDIIAISKDTSHRVALIELKVETSAFGGFTDEFKKVFNTSTKKPLSINDIKIDNIGSGILGHVYDYIRYLTSDKFDTVLKHEIVNIISNYNLLGLSCPVNNLAVTEIYEKPEIYFIIIGCDKTIATQQILKYIENGQGSSLYNVQKVLGYDLNQLKQSFLFHFQLSNNFGQGINDIIDYKNYTHL